MRDAVPSRATGHVGKGLWVDVAQSTSLAMQFKCTISADISNSENLEII